MALFRVDYSGRGELADRQQKLNKMLSSLTKMSEQYNIAVVLTNQVMCVSSKHHPTSKYAIYIIDTKNSIPPVCSFILSFILLSINLFIILS